MTPLYRRHMGKIQIKVAFHTSKQYGLNNLFSKIILPFFNDLILKSLSYKNVNRNKSSLDNCRSYKIKCNFCGFVEHTIRDQSK